MRDILDPIAKWWDAGETFGLATVVRTYRSAPREPGAAMAVSADGEAVGSVSGGCVEGAVYELATEVRETGQPVLQTYGISDDDAFAVGLTCGGIIDILVERVGREAYPQLGEVAAAVRAEQPVAVATVTAGPGVVGARRVIWPAAGEPAAGGSDGSGSHHEPSGWPLSAAQMTRRAPTWPGPAITVATATGSPRSTAAAISPSSGKLARSTRSTKMSMIPPQVSPTANASSSLTPYVSRTGSPAWQTSSDSS